MEVGPALVFGLMWLIFSALRKAGSSPSDKNTPRRPPPGRPPTSTPRSRQLPAATRTDATQREGLRLEDLLRELGRTLDQGSGPLGRPADRSLPPAEEVEEAESLEVSPEVRTLESLARRPERAVVDLDDEAERVAARRIAETEAHSASLTKADHQAFDARIRQEAPDRTTVGGYSTRQLRQAIVWREILGPPVSLRAEADPDR